MGAQHDHVMATRMLTISVTIPRSASPATVYSLVSTAMALASATRGDVLGFQVKELKVDGSSRAAILLGDASSNMKSYTAADTAVAPPISEIDKVYISAAAAGTITTACIEVYLK